MKKTATPIQQDDDQETELLRLAVEKARESVKQGRVVPHERVRGWLKSLAAGQSTPYPRP
ncbi:MAG: antitoxin [Rhodospirillales bacterium]|nr:antitoxin [Rhodospirillales bacterium]